MNEFVSRDQRIKDLESQVKDLEARIEKWMNPPQRNEPPRAVHSTPKEPAAPRSKEQIIDDIKKFRVR